MAKLIMTLLVRDEGDIIRENIEFHLRHGVDHIIATDNASVDDSREILAEYQAMGRLHLIDEPGRDKSQAAWNNRMARIAIEEYKADIVFHCDADEFWCPAIGDLKTELLHSQYDVLKVNLINVILENHKGKESLTKNKSYAIINPLDTLNYIEDTRNTNLYFYKYHPKVMFKTNKGLLEVNQGNHDIVNLNETISQGFSRNIFIFHFPVRGKERFRRKIIETGKAVEKNPLLGKSQSVHIRRWFDAYKSGTLDEEYAKLTITKDAATNLKESGMIADFDFSSFINNKRIDDLMYQIQKNQIDSEITYHKELIIAVNNQVLERIKSSLSWKLTKPVRFAESLLRGDWTAIRDHLSRNRGRTD